MIIEEKQEMQPIVDKMTTRSCKNSKTKLWLMSEEEKMTTKVVRVVGVIPDLHIPYHNKDAIKFLVKEFIKHKVTDVVIIGDILDNYWYGHKYLKDYYVMGPKEDFESSKSYIKDLYKEFPTVTFIIGNHDLRIVRRDDDGFVEDFEEVFRRKFTPPTTWLITSQWIFNDVCYVHGTGVSGQNGAVSMMRTKRMSTVIGHTHSFGGIVYSNNGTDCAFALNVGCLVDLNAPVFDYGLDNREKPVLGCGIIYNKSHADFIPFIV